MANANFEALPLVFSWEDSGVRITSKTANNLGGNLLEMTPSQYLDQIGNDLVRVTMNSGNTPVIIDLTEYYQYKREGSTAEAMNQMINPSPKINLFMPKLTLADYNEPNSFILELRNFSKSVNDARQVFLFRGLDVFYVSTDNCAVLSSEQNRIIVDVEKCDVKHIVLKGGLLDLTDVEQKIPDLCKKYNDRYFSQGEEDAFVCLKDCTDTGTGNYERLKHVRGLITKYNITDYNDEPLSFLGNLLLTKKGVGLNLKTEDMDKTKVSTKGKKASYNAYDSYRFFPWYEFINLSFEKYVDESQLRITDPYNNSYIYNSKVHFSNVELIQFFNELKDMISDQVNY
ncbi:hypothetical protein [Flavilitoribacter nigricans]|nr:hypothetical protein [Flavilitoribacter nigricans]